MEHKREDDRSISTLIMAVERLAESQSQMALSQSQMSNEIKDLTKTISKLDVVMEKLVNLDERHAISQNSTNERLKILEKSQIDGCPALRELKIGYEGKYNQVALLLKDNKDHIEKVQAVVNRIAWMIVSAVIVTILSLVIQH